MGCSDEQTQRSTTWLGGEIVNPKIDHVLLFRNEEVIDTIPLQDNNFFLYKSQELEPGLYSFQHHEYQVLFLEPGDSLMLRVNTVDFDESLTFTGRGAAKNNLMIEMFLLNEQEDKLISNFYLLEPADFEQKLDSLKEQRLLLLGSYMNKNEPSARFESLIRANIDYDFYARKELYVSAAAMNNLRRESDSIPGDFLAHRDSTDHESCDIHAHYSYYRYLNRLFDNLSYEQYSQQSGFDRNSFRHNYLRMQLIDSLIEHEHLKNMMLRTNIGRYLLIANDKQQEQNMVDLFLTANTNEEHHQEIRRLAENAMKLTPSNTVPNVDLVGLDNTSRDLHSIIRRPTVLYFWSTESTNHHRNIHQRVSDLQSRYPAFEFVGINTGSDYGKWKKVIQQSGYSAGREFQCKDVKSAQESLMIGSINKAIIIDAKGTIIEGNSNLFYQAIEDQLASLSN
jgi:hypothetical protein